MLPVRRREWRRRRQLAISVALALAEPVSVPIPIPVPVALALALADRSRRLRYVVGSLPGLPRRVERVLSVHNRSGKVAVPGRRDGTKPLSLTVAVSLSQPLAVAVSLP